MWYKHICSSCFFVLPCFGAPRSYHKLEKTSWFYGWFYLFQRWCSIVLLYPRPKFLVPASVGKVSSSNKEEALRQRAKWVAATACAIRLLTLSIFPVPWPFSHGKSRKMEKTNKKIRENHGTTFRCYFLVQLKHKFIGYTAKTGKDFGSVWEGCSMIDSL